MRPDRAHRPPCGRERKRTETALSIDHLTRMRTALARALSADDVNQLGRDVGQSERMRVVTPFRLFLATIASLAAGTVEFLADLLRELRFPRSV